jgi:hypothetical protein
MSTTVKKTGNDFVLPPAGTHRARCYRVIDLGTQTQTYNNQTKLLHQVLVGFELCDEMMDDGRPFVTSARYTASLHEKANLRHTLESWRGRAFTDKELEGFELKSIIQAPCLLTLAHEKSKTGDKTYANIKAITPLAKGMEKPPVLVNMPEHYEIEQGKNELFKHFPEWLQELIGKCQEWTKPAPAQDALAVEVDEAAAQNGDEDSQIPF